MKISILTAWNSASGSAVHAGFIGREWIKMGHHVSVFSFIKSDFPEDDYFLKRDESYVNRCFGTSIRTNFLDPRPILKTRADILVVEDLGMLPKNNLAKIFPLIREKAKIVNIIHDNKLSPDPSFYQFNWDKIIFFDQRYKDIFKNIYPEEKSEIIPYPCDFWQTGDKNKARERLRLPKDLKIIFSFGQRWTKWLLPYLSVLPKIVRKYPCLLLVVSTDKSIKKDYLDLEKSGVKVDFREKIIPPEELYSFLHAADIILFGDKKAEGVVLSSSGLMCLGAGTPIVAPSSNIFEMFGEEILKYSNLEELEENIIDVFRTGRRCKSTILAAEKFTEKNNPRAIAELYIELFKKLTAEG